MYKKKSTESLVSHALQALPVMGTDVTLCLSSLQKLGWGGGLMVTDVILCLSSLQNLGVHWQEL
jgi:hypothetical protein